MQFFKDTRWAAFYVGFRGVTTLIINKIIAIYFGSSGIAIFAHFQNLIGLCTQIPFDGLDRGAIKHLSEAQLPQKEKQHIVSAGVVMHGLFFALVLLTLLIWRKEMMAYFSGQFQSGVFVLIFGFCLAFIFANAFMLSLLVAQKQFKSYALLNSIAPFVALILIFWTSTYSRFEAVLLAYVFGQGIGFVFTAIYFYINRHVQWHLKLPLKESYKKLWPFVLMAFSVMVFTQLTDFLVRNYMLGYLGFELTGLWQAVAKISEQLRGVFVGVMGLVFFPYVATHINEKIALRKFLKSVIPKIGALIGLAVLAIILLKNVLLTLLYTADFQSASSLVPWQISGDGFAMLSFLLVYLISAKERTTMFIVLQALSSLVYLGLLYFLLPSFGVEALVISHFFRYLFFIVICFLAARKIWT